ncbi:MAG: UDP-2,3-diacylglucosamine diphosphatase LpxI [Kiritimatiellae bacterium]|nr:UDP-2,3-diacylglucosamine diphosphatase LpxI [Kiritimatiellia bacterium]
MNEPVPESLLIIAGRGEYPLLLADSARRHGVKRIAALAFKGETDSAIARKVDAVAWVRIGALGAAYDALQSFGIPLAVMAGQIKPTHLFQMRMDSELLKLMASLKEKNAHSIFGAIGDALMQRGITLMPASRFMESNLTEPGVLTRRVPTDREYTDIQLGLRVAKATSGLDIGQTVVVKDGTILAVEAFEGTDKTIRRAGEIGGPGAVVVKVAKSGHDQRFDLPVIGSRTLNMLIKAKAAVLAVESNRTILLGREALIETANRANVTLVAMAPEKPHAEIGGEKKGQES